MNVRKILWFDTNSEPPINYLWVKDDQKVYEWSKQLRKWVEYDGFSYNSEEQTCPECPECPDTPTPVSTSNIFVEQNITNVIYNPFIEDNSNITIETYTDYEWDDELEDDVPVTEHGNFSTSILLQWSGITEPITVFEKRNGYIQRRTDLENINGTGSRTITITLGRWERSFAVEGEFWFIIGDRKITIPYSYMTNSIIINSTADSQDLANYYNNTTHIFTIPVTIANGTENSIHCDSCKLTIYGEQYNNSTDETEQYEAYTETKSIDITVDSGHIETFDFITGSAVANYGTADQAYMLLTLYDNNVEVSRGSIELLF